MRSTVSITLAPACLVMLMRIAGWRLNHAAARLLRVDCSTVAIEPSRVTAPFADLTTISRYSRGSRIWVLVPMTSATPSLSNAPSGPAALALTIARRTSSRLIPIEAIATGLTRTRIAGCSAPLTLASATPSIWDSRWAMTVSAMS